MIARMIDYFQLVLASTALVVEHYRPCEILYSSSSSNKKAYCWTSSALPNQASAILALFYSNFTFLVTYKVPNNINIQSKQTWPQIQKISQTPPSKKQPQTQPQPHNPLPKNAKSPPPNPQQPNSPSATQPGPTSACNTSPQPPTPLKTLTP